MARVRSRKRAGRWLSLLFVASISACNPVSKVPAANSYVPPGCSAGSAASQTTPVAPSSPTDSPATQLEIFDRVVKFVNQYYVYPTFHGNNWPALAATYRSRIEAGVNTTTFYSLMSALMSALGDRHSHFLNPTQAAQDNAAPRR